MTSAYKLALKELLSQACPECGGYGDVDDASIYDIYCNRFVCPECGGTGYRNKEDDNEPSP